MLLEKLQQINTEQTEYRELQSIDLSTFLQWHDDCKKSLSTTKKKSNDETKQNWMWVASMCVLYGLRPGEIAAALNLDKPYTKDGVTIPAINDPDNKDLFLVLDDFTPNGASIKTGGRVCFPVTKNENLLERLRIQDVRLPSTKSKRARAFYDNFYKRMKSYQLPITQLHSFRHLANQLGEMYGISQEIRARGLGHSVPVNEYVYKRRNNLKTTLDILRNNVKQPMPFESAVIELERIGIDVDDPSVKLVLKVIYQLD